MLSDKDKELDSQYFQFNKDKCEPKEFKGHKDRILDQGFNMDGTKLASTSSDHKIIIWNLCGGNFDKSVELKGHNDFVDKIAWHPENENLLASVSIDKTVKFWDVRLKGSIRTEKTKNVYCNVVWSPDGIFLVVNV